MNISSPGHHSLRRAIWASRLALIVGVVALLFIHPLGCTPWYYIALASLGVLPLLCGPAVYRCLGGALVVAALAFALQQHRGGISMKAQVEQTRAESQGLQRQTQTP
jgi:hypothetical protein